MALARRRPWDGSWGPMLAARSRSSWNRASWARGLLSTVQTNTAMCPWPTSKRADSFGVSGGSAGTVGSSGHPEPSSPHPSCHSMSHCLLHTHSPGLPFSMPKPHTCLLQPKPSLVPPRPPPQSPQVPNTALAHHPQSTLRTTGADCWAPASESRRQA